MGRSDLKLYRCPLGHFERGYKTTSCFYCAKKRTRRGNSVRSQLVKVRDKGLLAAWRLGGVIAAYELQQSRDGILPDDMDEVRKHLTTMTQTAEWLRENFPVKEVKASTLGKELGLDDEEP